MSTCVRISTIGARAVRGRPAPDSEAVARMIAHWEGRFAQVLPDEPDLIVVPECCDRYPEHPMADRLAYYRERGEQVGEYFASVAKDNGCYVAYPAVREMEDGSWRNSVQLFDRDGESMGHYNKNHIVVTETIEGGILAGCDAPLFECDFGTVGCAICFDLNFSPIREAYIDSSPDLILFPSMYHGGLMQAYWAYSCRTHMVTSICGLPSGVLSPTGETLAMSTNYVDYVTCNVNLDCQVAHLDFNQPAFRALKEKYGPGVMIKDPGYLGSVLVTSEDDEVSSEEMVREFEIELLDDYIERSLAHRDDPTHQAPEERDAADEDDD